MIVVGLVDFNSCVLYHSCYIGILVANVCCHTCKFCVVLCCCVLCVSCVIVDVSQPLLFDCVKCFTGVLVTCAATCADFAPMV